MKRKTNTKNIAKFIAIFMIFAIAAVSFAACSSSLSGKYYEYEDGTGDYAEFGSFGKFTFTDDGAEYTGKYELTDNGSSIVLTFENALASALLNGTHSFEKGTTEDGQEYIDIEDIDTFYKAK